MTFYAQNDDDDGEDDVDDGDDDGDSDADDGEDGDNSRVEEGPLQKSSKRCSLVEDGGEVSNCGEVVLYNKFIQIHWFHFTDCA